MDGLSLHAVGPAHVRSSVLPADGQHRQTAVAHLLIQRRRHHDGQTSTHSEYVTATPLLLCKLDDYCHKIVLSVNYLTKNTAVI